MALLDAEGLVLFVLVAFWIWALIDVIATDSSLARNLPKGVWLILVIVLPDIGSLCWLLLGRPQGAGFWPGGSSGGGRHQPGYRGTPAYRSGDRPKYLGEYDITDRRSAELDAMLDRHLSTADTGVSTSGRDLSEWEADLSRREAEIRERELQARERELARREGELDS